MILSRRKHEITIGNMAFERVSKYLSVDLDIQIVDDMKKYTKK